jgi:uncharacterized membrane protein YqgA involved in biofilm formation
MYLRDYQVESFVTGFKIINIYVAAYNGFGVVSMKGVKYNFQLAQKEFIVTTRSSINTNKIIFLFWILGCIMAISLSCSLLCFNNLRLENFMDSQT